MHQFYRATLNSISYTFAKVDSEVSKDKLVWFSACSKIPKLIIAVSRRKEETLLIVLKKNLAVVVDVAVLVVDDLNTIRSFSWQCP